MATYIEDHVLAPAEQNSPRPVEEPRRADIVIGVHGASDDGDIARAGHRLGHQLDAAFPGKGAVVLLLSDHAGEPPAPFSAAPPDVPARRCEILPWNHAGSGALEAVLRARETFGADACALLTAGSEDGGFDVARRLLAPVVEEGFDLVSPCYVTHRYEGVLTTGLVYPLIRALFGKRLRQPMSSELAVSRRLGEYLLGEAWHGDPHAGEQLWVALSALSREFSVCQSNLAARPPPALEPSADLASSIAHVVNVLFHQMRLDASSWQRVKGSQAVHVSGPAQPAPREALAPQIGPMVKAFQLGYQELGRLWGSALPPQSLLALKRLASAPEEAFRMDDALWARIVYDFAVGYHLAVMDRALLLRSMTPLYLGWAAGFVQEVRDLEPEAVEERVERLARAFETAKPYLISRWRWPDRFNP